MIKQLMTAYLSGPVPGAICRTLFYSLGIGILTAALAGLVILLTKRTSASIRYRLFCALLVLFTAVTFFTFYIELEQAVIPFIPATTAASKATASLPAGPLHFFNLLAATHFVGSQAAWIFSLWAVCCLIKSIKLSRELLYVRRVRTTAVRPVTGDWKTKVASFAERLGIPRAITLLESGLVKVPVTIGHLKPIILLPTGILLQLSPEQVESILWHELAHILRRDYLVGILQSILETLFFFNPAVLWLSAHIRQEREACCDDLVLAHVTHKHPYLEALVAFQSVGGISGNLAMGLGFRRNQLVNRLQRIISRENQKLRTAEKVILLCGLFLLAVFTFIPDEGSAIRKEGQVIQIKVAATLMPVHKAEAMASIRVKHKVPAPAGSTNFRSVVTIARADTILPKVFSKVQPKNVLLSASVVSKAALLGSEPEPKFKLAETEDRRGKD